MCLVNEGMWRWTKPFGIDAVGIQTVPLHVSSCVTNLFVEITSLGGLQRVVTFRGSWMFTSYLPCPVEVGLVASVQLGQEEKELEEIRGGAQGMLQMMISQQLSHRVSAYHQCWQLRINLLA